MVARMWAPLVSAVLTKNHSTAAQRQRWNLRMPQIKSLNARMTGHSTTTRRITIGCRPSGSCRVFCTHSFFLPPGQPGRYTYLELNVPSAIQRTHSFESRSLGGSRHLRKFSRLYPPSRTIFLKNPNFFGKTRLY